MGEVVAVYSDGGLIGTNGKCIGGTYAFCHVDKEGNRVLEGSGVILPGTKDLPADRMIENNLSETYALFKAVSKLPSGWYGKVYCDNKNALGRLLWGYKAANIPRSWFDAISCKIQFKACEGILLGGHPTQDEIIAGYRMKDKKPVSIHNVWCDDACNKARREYEESLEIRRLVA